MKQKPIKTEQEYNEALIRFEKIFQSQKGTKESKEADILSVLIKKYEEKYFKI